MTVVYDGWALAYDPNSPAAIHLLTLLHAHPPEWKAILALPAASFHPIPQGVETRFIPCENSPLGSLRWEQRLIPILAHQCEATWIHTVGGGPPLFTSSGRLLSPAGFTPGSSAQPMQRRTLAERARVALSAGGLSQARWTLWPQDLPTGGVPGPLYPLPPAVPPPFCGEQADLPSQCPQLASLELPETYILYHGPSDEGALRSLLDAWSWAADSIGLQYPLLLVGLDSQAQERLAALLAEYQLTGTARPLPPLSLPCLAYLYRHAGALFHPYELSPWGDPMRLALACGTPIVGLESQAAAALVGPAAYLTPEGDSYVASRRTLGAALLSVIVEEALAERLSQAGFQRSVAWSLERLQSALRHLYRSETRQEKRA